MPKTGAKRDTVVVSQMRLVINLSYPQHSCTHITMIPHFIASGRVGSRQRSKQERLHRYIKHTKQVKNIHEDPSPQSGTLVKSKAQDSSGSQNHYVRSFHPFRHQKRYQNIHPPRTPRSPTPNTNTDTPTALSRSFSCLHIRRWY